MAVSMSTGGSGYMRSDFMISDAAIPLRVEESMEQADNSEQFSKVLNGIGEARNEAGGSVSDSNADTVKELPEDIHRLAEAVASGEIKPEDIPEELFTRGMLEELTKLVEAGKKTEIKEDIPDFSKDPEVQELVSELAAMIAAQQPAVTPDDKTEELSALTAQPEVQAVQSVEVLPEQTMISQPLQEIQQSLTVEIPKETVEVAAAVSQEQLQFEPEAEETGKSEQTVRTLQKQPVQTVQKQPMVSEESPAVQQKPDNTGENAEQQSDFTDSGQGGAIIKAEAVPKQPEAQPAEFSRIREDIESVEVKTGQKAPATEQAEQPVFPQHNVQRSRVVSKSDELQMIKDSAKPADENANAAQVPVQPQTQPLTAEKPVVVFTGSDGGEVQVKPSEVAQQVVDRLVERTENLSEGETEYSITLNPEELGRITVRMTKTADGAVSVSIAAENSRTLKIIEDNGAAIQDTLKQNGVQLESWQTVGESGQETHAEDYQGSSKNPYRENENHREEQDSDGESFAEIIASM